MNSSLDKDRWYIDISGRIELMTAWQIIEGLLSLNLKIIYRVSRDKVKWAAICNQPYFEDAVQDLIKTLSDQATKYGAESAQKAGLGESTGFTNIKNITSQINDQLEHANQLQEINVHLQRLRNLAGDIAAKKKLIISAQTKADEEELHPDDKNEYLNNPSLWERIQARFNFANSKTRQRLIFSGLAFAIILVLINKYREEQHAKEVRQANEQAQLALQAQVLGEYDKAVSLFSEVKNTRLLPPKTLLQMAETYIQTGQLDRGTELLDNAMKITDEASEKAQANSLLGFIALKNKHGEAAESYYNESLKHEELFSSLYNLAIYNLDIGKADKSEVLLLKSIRLAENELPLALLALFETGLDLDTRANDAQPPGHPKAYPRLERVFQLLKSNKSQSNPYYEQILIAQIVITAAMNNSEQFNLLLDELLDSDPTETKSIQHKYGLDLHRTTWSHIKDWCLGVYKNGKIIKTRAALYAYCITKIKNVKDALPYAQYAFINTPEPTPNLRGFIAFLAASAENYVGAKQVLREGNTTGSRLAQKANAIVCKQIPDSSCFSKK